jgi:hypothetical protein
MSAIRADMSQYYPMKAVLEQVLGRAAYRKLKETGTLKDWKEESTRLLQAIELSIKVTVQVADSVWRKDIQNAIAHGKALLASSKSIDEMFSSLSATLIRVIFLQLGFMPNRMHMDRVTLTERNWQLDVHRSVQFVQNEQQQLKLATYLSKRLQKTDNRKID